MRGRLRRTNRATPQPTDLVAEPWMTLRRPPSRRDPFPASSAGGLATLTGGLLAVTRLPVDGPQIRVRVIIASDEVIHLISAREPTDMADAPMVTEDPLALRVPPPG